MTLSKILLFLCLFFVAGIAVGSFFLASKPLLLAFLISGIFLISVFWRFKKAVVFGFCILFLALGVWRHQLAELKFTNNELRELNNLEEKITLIGRIAEEPDIRTKTVKLTIKITQTQYSENTSRNIEGKVLVTVWRDIDYQYGDKLKITGKLENPSEDIEGFNYKDFLKKEGIHSVMSFPEIELSEPENGGELFSVIYAGTLKFKNKLRKSLYQNLSPPQSVILGAMILGDKRKLSEELKTKLNIAGLRHITAISGLHVTILTSLLMTFFIGLGLWRQQAFWFSLILITLFIIMTGLQPSAIRAGIMGGLFLLGQYLGRQSFSSRSIIFASALMLALNPFLLRLDAGFQLSFLAMMGIIYLMPVFKDWLKFIPEEEKVLNLRSILAMTLAAQVFTLPILIYNFGYFSLVAPLTNVLIVPLLPFIMLSGFVFGLSGMIFQPLGWVLSWLSWGLLTYLIKIVDWFSRLPLASLSVENLHWFWLIFSYLILGFITWRLVNTQKLKFLNY